MTDRDVILARRALFVASALASIAPNARADETASATLCDVPDEPVEALPEAAEAAKQGGDLALAARLFDRFLRCKPDDPRAERARKALDALAVQIGVLTLEAVLPDADVFIDGEAVQKPATGRPLYVTPAEHVLELHCADGLDQRIAFVVQAGESRTVRIQDACVPPMPCLSPCLEPPPPPPANRRAPHFGIGVAALEWIDVIKDGHRSLGGGARVEGFRAFPVGEAFGMRLGVAALPAITESGSLTPVGADLEATFGGKLNFGLGATAGYAFSFADRSENEAFRPRPSAFVYPYLELGMALGDSLELGAHFGMLFSKQASLREEQFRAGWLTTGLWFRVRFGEAPREDLEYASGVRRRGL